MTVTGNETAASSPLPFARRDRIAKRSRAADACATYTLRATPDEVSSLVAKLDELIRRLIAATRARAPKQAALVHVRLQAFPREESR